MTAHFNYNCPHGPIPRVERQDSHYKFLWTTRPPYAMVDLIHARRIVAYDDEFFPPETEVILTSTISDEKLASISFIDELRIIHSLQPDFVIPFDFPVYEGMSQKERKESIMEIVSGTIDISNCLNANTITDLPQELQTFLEDNLTKPSDFIVGLPDATVLPLIKGYNTLERSIMVDCATQINAPCLVKYGVQYMTVGEAGNYPALVTSLEEIANESQDYPVLVIGLQSPSGMFSLEGVPNNVVAAAGTNQWTKHVSPSSSSHEQMKTQYTAFSNDVCETLGIDDPYHAPKSDTSMVDGLEKNPGKAVTDTLDLGDAGAAGDEDYGFGQRKRPRDAADALTAGLQGALKDNM